MAIKAGMANRVIYGVTVLNLLCDGLLAGRDLN